MGKIIYRVAATAVVLCAMTIPMRAQTPGGAYSSPASNSVSAIGWQNVTLFSGTSLAQANAADAAIGTAPGITIFPQTFDSTLDYFQNSGTTWSDRHAILDLRSRNPNGFSGVPGNFMSPWSFNCMVQSDPTSGASGHVDCQVLTQYHIFGGVNPLGGSGKSTFASLELGGQIQGIGQDFLLNANGHKHGVGDIVGTEITVDNEGNCPASGDECLDGGRFQIQQDSGSALMTGTISAYTSGVMTFSATTNKQKVGLQREFVELTTKANPNATGNNVPYSVGTLASITGSGTLTVTGNATTWATDFCPSGTGGAGCNAIAGQLCFSRDNDTFNTAKFMIPITGITSDTVLTLSYTPQNTNNAYPTTVTNGDAYHIYYCNQVSTFAYPYGSVTFPTASGYQGWANADSVEQELGYLFLSAGMRIISAVNTPSNPGNYTLSLINQGRPLRTAVNIEGVYAHALKWNTTATADTGTTGWLSGPSMSIPIIQLTDTANDQTIWQQPAATSNSRSHHTPSSNTYGIGTTGGGDFWTVVTNTGATTQKGNFAFNGGKGQHVNTQSANNDLAGVATCVTSTVTVTFTTAYTSTPVILVSDETTSGGARVSAKSNSSFTITCTGASDVVDYATFGNPN